MLNQTNACADSNTPNGINSVIHVLITQNTIEIDRTVKRVKAGVAREGSMQEVELELGVGK